MNITRDRILTALLTSCNLKEVAEKSGVAARTLYTYINTDEELQQAYTEQQALVLKEVSDKMMCAMTEAVTVLTEIMEDKKQSSKVRVDSAKAVLDYGLRYYEVVDQNERIRKLENKIKQKGANK
jgi:AcrR family transcriptional regulator